MRILVTGATGFLGKALTRQLLARGDEVIATGRDELQLARLAARGAKTFAYDLTSAHADTALKCDAVAHCAALCAPWGRAEAFYQANVIGTHAALRLARTAGARRFVLISTPSVYFRFADQIGVREDTPLPPPINAYTRTKREAERLVLAATDLDPLVLRPRGLYGAGDTTLLPRLIAAARTRALPLLREGRAATDLTHVEDAANAVCRALTISSPLVQRIYNISGGVALNVRDVAERAAQHADVSVRWRKAPVWLVLNAARALEAICRLHPAQPEPAVTAYGAALFAFTQTLDIAAAKTQLGWSPAIGFDEGLARTFEQAA